MTKDLRPWRLESRTPRTPWEVNPTFGTFENAEEGEREVNEWRMEVWRVLGAAPLGREFRLVHRRTREAVYLNG